MLSNSNASLGETAQHIPRVKAVLFDMNGVLIDDEDLHESAFAQTLKRVGIPLDHSGYMRWFAGRTDEGGFQALADAQERLIDVVALVREKSVAYRELAQTKLRSFPGIPALIRTLAEEELLPLAIVTSSTRAEYNAVVQALGIIKYVRASVTVEDVTHPKPNPQGYQRAASLLGVECVDCLIVEDSPVGIRAAVASGARCVAVAHTHAPEELREAHCILPALTLDRLLPLLELVK